MFLSHAFVALTELKTNSIRAKTTTISVQQTNNYKSPKHTNSVKIEVNNKKKNNIYMQTEQTNKYMNMVIILIFNCQREAIAQNKTNKQ